MKPFTQLLRFVKPYWKQSVLALILLTAVVFMDLAIPRLIQRIIDEGINGGSTSVVIQTTLIMLGISVTSALFSIGNNFLSVQAGEGYARDLREALFLRIQSFSFGNLDRLRTGQLIVRLTSDITTLQRAIRMLLRIGTRAPLLMIGSVILMVQTNAQLALSMLPIFLVVGAALGFFINKLGPLFLTVQKKLDNLNTVLQENISGVRVVKAFVRAVYEGERFEEANDDFTAQNIVVMQTMSALFPALLSLINVGIVILIWLGGIQSVNGTITIGEIVAFANYLQTAIFPLLIMAMISTSLASGFASAERVCDVLNAEPEVQDQAETRALPANLQGRVVFDHVGFHYNGASDEPVLCNINLTAEPGEMVAILGATGAGKSTLVNLIPRFYDVSEGCITLDGIDIRALPQAELLTQIGVALQETVLFSGTVRENIAYGQPEAPLEAVIAAAQAAQAHDFIADLPEGYDTHVEARGVNLSGGQKQRVAIARALLTRPKILILDDSTSAVDVETETKIQAALSELMETCTSFVVAQRISTVLNADKIIVIDKGEIAAEGTHTQLMATSPIYQEIYDSQLGDGFDLSGNS